MEQRATVCGADAARYDRSRPSYPAGLIDVLVTRPGTRVLDVGCGTGIASTLFAERGCEVLGVEPDARMAAVARNRGIEVEVARFEDWIADGRVFDVVVSAQAWHWVDPVVGPTLARRALSRGGTLAIIWNVPRHDPAVQAAFEDLYDRFRLPDGSRCSPPGALAGGSDRFIAGIDTAGGFNAPVETTSSWSLSYTTAEWNDLLPTHSDHRLLPVQHLHGLLEATGTVIDDFGGQIEVTYTTHLITAATT
jgi:SAM-dependent methyltransferase